MKKNKLFWILTVVCVLNFAAHLYFYPSLPDIVPTHWGASGQVNGGGPKSTVLILAALPFAMLILFEVIRKIDPKHQNFEKFGKVWNLFVVLFTVMMAMFSWLSEWAVFGKLPDMPDFQAAMCMPVMVNKSTRGVLCLAHTSPRQIDESMRSFVRQAVDHLALFLENLYLKTRLRTMLPKARVHSDGPQAYDPDTAPMPPGKEL